MANKSLLNKNIPVKGMFIIELVGLLLVTNPSIPRCLKSICAEKNLLTALDVLHNQPLLARL